MKCVTHRLIPAIILLLCLSLPVLVKAQNVSFKVNGDFDKFYPVAFSDCNWLLNKPTELELGRSNVHTDSDWRGSVMAKFRYHVLNWGHRSQFIDADILQGQPGLSQNVAFIAGWEDASVNNGTMTMVIWLRGGQTTYWLNSSCGITPVVYDGVQNALPYSPPGMTPYNYRTDVSPLVNANGFSTSKSIFYTGINPNYINSSLGIGTNDTKGYKLAVNGDAIFTKVKVKGYDAWPDFVFDESYQLPSLESIATSIAKDKHLPGMPSAAEVKEQGQDVGNIQMLQQQKIEELTLYLIQLKKESVPVQQVEALSNDLNQLKKLVAQQQEMIKILEEKISGKK